MDNWLIMHVRINTPDGFALKVEPRLKRVLMPMGAKSRTEIKDGNTILWTVDCTVKQMLKLQRSVLMFDKMSQDVFNNKAVNKLIRANVNSMEDYELLKELFAHHTKVELLKGNDD